MMVKHVQMAGSIAHNRFVFSVWGGSTRTPRLLMTSECQECRRWSSTSLNGALPKIAALRMLFETDQLGSFGVIAGQDTL